MHLLLLFCTCGLPGPQEDSSRICSSVYIISKKKRLVYMHNIIVIYIVIIMVLVIIMVVFYGLPGPQEKDDSARRIWIWILGYYFLTHWEWAHMRITSIGIIKGCVQRDQFHQEYECWNCYNFLLMRHHLIVISTMLATLPRNCTLRGIKDCPN